MRSVPDEYLPSRDDDGFESEPHQQQPGHNAAPFPAPLAPAALHGLAGDVVGIIDSHTESDPAAVLLMFLSAFGNMAGSAAHFLAEARKHPPRIFAVLVGETAKGRKGSAWSSLRHVLSNVDKHWLDRCTASGLSSGEGLIWAIRNPILKRRKNKKGETEEYEEDPGVTDKRLFTVEEEFSAVLKVASREANTLSDIVRGAWDHGDLRTMTKNSPARATGAHITIIGHITKPDLSRLLCQTDALNGFGNRFLWGAVRRSKLLPDGGSLHTLDLGPLVLHLRRALDFARTAGHITKTEPAAALWRDVYPVLTADRAGIFGALTNRAEAQVMRLALIYALLDLSRQIDKQHLEAALAVWEFCENSARFIFGASLGDRIADRILDELRCSGTKGLARNAIREQVFKRNVSSARIDEGLALLLRLNLVIQQELRGSAGRPAIVWKATPTPETR
jgi:hypothetical protein